MPQFYRTGRNGGRSRVQYQYDRIPRGSHRFGSKSSLAEYLKKQAVLGVEDLDTRALTRHIRKAGAMRAFVSTANLNPTACIEQARKIPSMAGQDLVKNITTRQPYRWIDGRPVYGKQGEIVLDRNVWKHRGHKPAIVAFDYGIKYNILRCLEGNGFEIVVIPATENADTVRAMEPDGVFLSNGPGDPEPITYAIDTIRQLVGQVPIFGICLGHQLLGIALGGKTFKLKFGHRGANQPVKNLLTGRVEITSQNHGFAVDTASLEGQDIEITHINLNDNTLEGFRHREYPLFTAQYHPEASPGPHDARYMFADFKEMVQKR